MSKAVSGVRWTVRDIEVLEASSTKGHERQYLRVNPTYFTPTQRDLVI